jgi:hypothetical protein
VGNDYFWLVKDVFYAQYWKKAFKRRVLAICEKE